MRFVAQDLGSGLTRLVTGAAPSSIAGHLIVLPLTSLVSAGTERMLVDFGRANLVQKALQQPDRVRDVVNKARTDGIGATADAVRSKLAQPIALGYAAAGIVTEVGNGVTGFSAGQLVATNGAHAEVVAVPATLAAAVPDGVEAEEACFASVASVALQGLRVAEPQLGERFVVVGLGLIGLIAAQLLRANGCAVLGVDPNPTRRGLAEGFGVATADVDGAEEIAQQFSAGRGADGVVVCASSKSSNVMRSAIRMCRRRGRVVLVGVTGLELDRAELYEHEVTLQVSSAYGPGRYDPSYESGQDYPYGYVRWTAGRNMAAVLDQIAAHRLDVASLITHRFPFDDAPQAYDALSNDPSALGIVLQYPDAPPATQPISAAVPVVSRAITASPDGEIAVIGAGNFASRSLAPAIKASGASVSRVASRAGTSAAILADSIGAAATTNVDALLADPAISTVFIATRHDSHASLTAQALRAGKHVYVEKPLAVDREQLEEVTSAVNQAPQLGVLTVGFNRRFAPFTAAMREALETLGGAKAVVVTVNAGKIPTTHWTQDATAGGGRIVGEGCHFIDLARHLVGSPITDVGTHYLDSVARDTATISLSFADGSTAHVHYFANGSARYPKERVEVFAGGRVIVNENFRTLRFYGWPGRRTIRTLRQDKGHAASVAAFLAACRGERDVPIPLDELIEVSHAVLAAGTGG